MIPDRPKGYSVETATGVVHERYQDHAPNALKVRTFEAVANAAGELDPVPCRVCFPAPKPAPKRKAPAKPRRTTKRVTE